MAFDFPNSPTTNQIVPGPGGSQYQWDGVKWVVYNSVASSAYVLKAGDTMGGPLGFGDSNYNAQLAGGVTPALTFDTNDSLTYSRPNNQFRFNINAATQFTIASGFVQFSPNFVIDFSTSSPFIQFDSTDYLTYNRAGNEYDWFIGGTQSLYLNSNGLGLNVGKLALLDGNFWLGEDGAPGSNPIINFDTNDYLQYYRSNNTIYYYNNNQLIQSIGTLSWSYYGAYMYLNASSLAYNANLYLMKPTSGNYASLVSGSKGSSNRWQLVLGDASAETGSSNGSSFAIYAYDDNGNYIRTNMSIWRSNGGTIFYGGGLVQQPPSGNDAYIAINKPASGVSSYLAGQTNGTNRWTLYLGDSTAETGSNVGSDFGIARLADNGAWIDWAFQLTRSTGQFYLKNAGTINGGLTCNSTLYVNGTTTMNNNLNVSGGNISTAGIVTVGAGVYGNTGAGQIVVGRYVGGSIYNGLNLGITTAGTQASCQYNGTSNTATWTCAGSDRRLKSNIKLAGDALDIINRVKVYDVDYKLNIEHAEGFVDEPEHWPFSIIADEMAEVMPHAAMWADEDDGRHWIGLHSPHLCTILWRAVQQLTAQNENLNKRVAALEAR